MCPGTAVFIVSFKINWRWVVLLVAGRHTLCTTSY